MLFSLGLLVYVKDMIGIKSLLLGNRYILPVSLFTKLY